jgi:hypothetical protein
MAKEMLTAEAAMNRSSRVATISRLRMSRPSWSVPAQCAAVGGCKAIGTSEATGL